MSSPVPRTSRRAVLTGGTLVGVTLATAGCGATRAQDRAAATADDPTAPAVDTDSDLVESVGGRLATALALAAATGRSAPQLRPLARRLSTLHRAHLRELSQPDDVEDGGRVAGSTATARARLLRSEEKLQQQLVGAALAAESGALAQVFASMAAAVAQERAVAS
ncbi:hypothetical protein [Nocardioides bizhenqiangii]|uniref:Uncharacterized protein n=1 Tax=Nocardioides bizhenqiangii TaxID=3095076 RepID=A0ABZ0ZLE2_9ACTN|nr:MULTISPECIES: hypothetical protein [unclassified Nocardioides]MDZ5620772.1 hypothetical protein [Nocardioides sp. HM23]WQQ25137.1 hypothetical protein SHK19_14320 [Nocardioides sp. HM61]